MADLSPELVAKIQTAKDSRAAALQSDAAHDTAVNALNEAHVAEQTAADAALQAHRQAGSDADAAFAALDVELGIPVPTPATNDTPAA